MFTVCLDGRAVKKFGYAYAAAAQHRQGDSRMRYVDDIGLIPFAQRAEYTDADFSQALAAYRQQPIAASLHSGDPIVRMFSIVDRRVGKRTLEKIRDTAAAQPDWLRAFYEARLAAEGMA